MNQQEKILRVNSDLTKELKMYQKLIVEFAQDYEQNKNGMSEDTRKEKRLI